MRHPCNKLYALTFQVEKVNTEVVSKPGRPMSPELTATVQRVSTDCILFLFK